MNPVPRFFPAMLALLWIAAVAPLVISSPGQTLDPELGPPLDPIINPPDPAPCPTLRAGDITTAKPAHEVKLFFPWWSDLDEHTLGNGDLVSTGPNQYRQRAQFVSAERLPLPFPLPLHVPAEGSGEIATLPQAHSVVVATYRFLPPARSTDPDTRTQWSATGNGQYLVHLVEGEIANSEGAHFPPKLLGSFRCAIRTEPPLSIQPTQVRCTVRSHRMVNDTSADGDPAPAARYHAMVKMSFRTPHVSIDWGNVVREGDTFLVRAEAVRLPVPGPDLDPVTLRLAGARDPEPNPGGGSGPAPDLLPSFDHRYDLGSPAPGDYRLVFLVNGTVECSDVFTVPPTTPIDDEPPGAELAARNITLASSDPQRLVVTYRDRSGVDLRTVGDGDVVVLHPCLFLGDDAPVRCDWEAQRARFVEILAVSEEGRVVKALYEIDAPQGGWNHQHNGFYPVLLWEDAVCDRLGNCSERSRLGGFEVTIDPTRPPVPAEAQLKVDPSNPDRVQAKVHIRFRDYFEVTNQAIRRDGNRIHLTATAAPYAVPAVVPAPPFPQEELSYEIGPLPEGEFITIFTINGHTYDAKRFFVKRDPPIPAKVDLVIDSSDPRNVFATVTVQFRTPHRLAQAEVRRDGHRIVLPARAEPLPVLLSADGVTPDGSIDPTLDPPVVQPPPPVTLTYRIGAVAPGGYLGVFEMNGHPYAREDFVVGNPSPPIDAEVSLRIVRDDPANTLAVATIKFRSPHVITERDLTRRGNHFLLAATAVPVPALGATEDSGFVPVPVPQLVTIEYPLGALDPGDYGATFLMNGWPYARTSWTVEDNPLEADVEITVVPAPSGSWKARVTILFRDPHVRIVDPGEAAFRDHLIMINARAARLPVDPAIPAPSSEPIELEYDLGNLRPGGYWLKYVINGHLAKRHDFVVEPEPPIPAHVDLKVDASQSPVQAKVLVQFRDHYRITAQSVHRYGNLFVLDATADGPLPILAPLPPPPTELRYDLGSPRPGSYYAAFRLNGHFYSIEPFRVNAPGLEAKVNLSIESGGSDAKLTAVVDFADPYVIITNPGRPTISGHVIKINATAERVTFVQEPSGDPVTLHYALKGLSPGTYRVDYCLNGVPEDSLRFSIPGPCEQPANVSHIRIAQADASWLATVGVILSPGQDVTDWGMVRRLDSGFHVNITVGCIDYPVEPAPRPRPIDPDLLDGIMIDADGHATIDGHPVRLVTHDYRLGVLDPGAYSFCVHSLGQTVACQRFLVPGGDPPRVDLEAGNITEPRDEHHFAISYHDPTGLDHDSIRNAQVWIVSNSGFREEARLVDYASTDDHPSTGASARYAVQGPGGSWSVEDNGKYAVLVDPLAIRDLQGNHIEEGRLGTFYVRILPEPPDPGVNVSVARNALGEWEATVEINSRPGQQVVVTDWDFLALQFGHSLVRLADAEIEATSDPVEPVSHVYNLGMLQPGYYVFVFKTDLAHCGNAGFTVPGAEGDPLDNWQIRVGAAHQGEEEDRDLDGLNLVGEYFFLTDPHRADAPDVQPELVTGPDGREHFGLRLRHLHGAEGVRRIVEGSPDLRTWHAIDDQIEVIDQRIDLDGSVEVLLCLRAALEESPYRFLRVGAIRDRD